GNNQWTCEGGCGKWLSATCINQPGATSPAAGGSATKDQCKARGMSNDGVLCTDIGITEGQQKCWGNNQWTCEGGCGKWLSATCQQGQGSAWWRNFGF
ncbi:MAG: hypothetical protein HQK54_04675, partial [Oligoflexales bacterium]|nr:hypothetical protein [Oligoflexales bacterium]